MTVVSGVITASEPSWTVPFTGLSRALSEGWHPRCAAKVRIRSARAAVDMRHPARRPRTGEREPLACARSDSTCRAARPSHTREGHLRVSRKHVEYFGGPRACSRAVRTSVEGIVVVKLAKQRRDGLDQLGIRWDTAFFSTVVGACLEMWRRGLGMVSSRTMRTSCG